MAELDKSENDLRFKTQKAVIRQIVNGELRKHTS